MPRTDHIATRDPAPARPGGRPRATRRIVLAAVAFASLVLLLAHPALSPRGIVGSIGLGALRTGAGLLGAGLRVAGWAAAEALRFVPLGVAAVLALPSAPPRGGAGRRLGAAAVAVLGALASVAFAAGGAPLALGLLLPATGAALGAVAADAAWRGPRAVLRVAAGLGALAIATAGAAALVAALALRPAPAVAAPAPPSSEGKLSLFAALRGANPRSLAPGTRRTVRLTAEHVRTAAAWASTAQRHGALEVRLLGEDRFAVAASLLVPGTGRRWLDLTATLRARVEGARIALEVEEAWAGRVPIAPSLGDALAAAALAAARSDPRGEAIVSALEEARVAPDAVTLTVRRVELAPGALAGLVWGEDGSGALRQAVGAQVVRLVGALPASPPGDGRFLRALQVSFGLARERAARGSALEENRAALIALGAVLGHERLGSISGAPLDPASAATARALRAGTTAHGRGDWVRHFVVSGGLAALASVSPADAAGLFKEERDAAGGSGFSFGDLLADRAGTSLGETALRDEATAAAVQERLARGVALAEVFPPAADLPEGIPDDELRTRYGGVGGPRYRELADEIERRVASRSIHRP